MKTEPTFSCESVLGIGNWPNNILPGAFPFFSEPFHNCFSVTHLFKHMLPKRLKSNHRITALLRATSLHYLCV